MPERWLTYRSSDGSLYVDFYFAEYEDGSGWRIYIISPVSYTHLVAFFSSCPFSLLPAPHLYKPHK